MQMARIEKVVPDLLDRGETLALGGVGRRYSDEEEKKRTAETNRVLSTDGVYVSPGESPVAYINQTPEQIVKSWGYKPQKFVYLYGGWGNGMTLWFNIWRFLGRDIPLDQVKMKDIKEALLNPDRPRIYYDYRSDYDSLSGWKNMLVSKLAALSVKAEPSESETELREIIKSILKNPGEYEETTIAFLLTVVGGAPTRWATMVSLPEKEEVLLPPTTSTPFPGAGYGNGFIFSDTEPVFSGGEIMKSICNSTGSRAADSIALGNLLVRLRHDTKTAIEVYIEDARKRLEEIAKREVKPPFTAEDAGKYAPLFVETQDPVVEDIIMILSKYPDESITGFQYAVNITSDRQLATAIYKIPASRPYCWVKTAKGWKVAV